MTVVTSQGVVAFVRIINPEDRSLEGVRYIKIAVSIESKSVGGGKIIAAEYDRVLAHIRIIYLSRATGGPMGGIEATSSISVVSVKFGRDPLNLGSAEVADINLVVPRVKLKSQERSPTKISLGDKLAIFIKPQKFIAVGTKVEGG